MQSLPYLNTEYLGFLMDKQPIDIRLRKAINYCFNRSKMITYLRNGIGYPAVNGFIPKGLPAFCNGTYGYDYNFEKALALVNDYQSEKGELPIITLSTNSSYLDLCQYIQYNAKKVGLQININTQPLSTLRQAIATSKTPFFRGSWIADYPDSENYLSLFYSKNFCPDGPNYTHFKDDLFDLLYQKSFQEVDIKKRLKIYQKMDSILMSKAPIVPLYYDQVVRFYNKNISGLKANAINLLNLKTVRKLTNN